MSVTSGFFNSLNHDRRYNAQQMSAIFDGIINDGVFANIGVAFAINADTGVTITIGKGKAWFNSAWVYNDALLPKTLEGSEVVLDRIDAVVIEVDHNESVRMGDIKIVKGTPSSSPQRPTIVNTEKKSQHPLAYIYRKAGSTEITQADITNMVGTSSCPYITGILQVQNIDNIVAQWEGQWNQWYAEKVAQTDVDASELLAEMKSDFEIWFADIQALLDDDAATALAAEVAELQGKFDDLARDGAVYDTIEDSALDVILGSDGTPIRGKFVVGGGGSANENAGDVTIDMSLSDEAEPNGINADTLGGRLPEYYATAESVNQRISMELLWENVSPTSQFAAQTLSLDLSNYDAVFIEACLNNGQSDFTLFGFAFVGMRSCINLNDATSTSFARWSSRRFDTTKTSIKFENAWRVTSNSGAFTIVEMKDYCVPIRIYGIKGVPA